MKADFGLCSSGLSVLSGVFWCLVSTELESDYAGVGDGGREASPGSRLFLLTVPCTEGTQQTFVELNFT